MRQARQSICESQWADEPAAALANAGRKGYSQPEILGARQQVQQCASDDAAVRLSNDPKAMAVATPDEKAKMIRQLLDGRTTNEEDRAIVSILQSAESRQEYDKILARAGGRKVGQELDDGEASKKFDRLAGAYDRLDLALDPQEAAKTRGVLLDHRTQENLLGGADSRILQPQTASCSMPEAERAKIAARVDSLDRRAVVDTVTENAVRQGEGKPPIDPLDIREQVEAAMNDPSQSPKQREESIDRLRKQTGISEYTMRNIATQPIARIYEGAAQESAAYAQANLAHGQQELRSVEAQFGQNSPQAQVARARLEQFQAQMEGFTRQTGGVAQALDGLYPPPKGFWSSFGGAVAGVAKIAAPALLNLIPGVGTALYLAYQGGRATYDGIQGNWAGMCGDIIGVAPGVGNLVGGAVGQGLKTGSQIAGAGLGVEQAIQHGSPMALLGAAGGVAGNFTGLEGNAGHLAENVRDGLNTAQAGVGLVTGLASGDAGQIVGGLGGINDQVSRFAGADSSLGRATGQGLRITDGVMRGDFRETLSVVADHVDADSRLARTLEQADRGLSVYADARSGNFSGSLHTLGVENSTALRAASSASGALHAYGAATEGRFQEILPNLSQATEGQSQRWLPRFAQEWV